MALYVPPHLRNDQAGQPAKLAQAARQANSRGAEAVLPPKAIIGEQAARLRQARWESSYGHNSAAAPSQSPPDREFSRFPKTELKAKAKKKMTNKPLCQARKDSQIELHVTSAISGDHICTFSLAMAKTVKDIKQAIYEAVYVPLNEQQVLHDAVELQDSTAISSIFPSGTDVGELALVRQTHGLNGMLATFLNRTMEESSQDGSAGWCDLGELSVLEVLGETPPNAPLCWHSAAATERDRYFASLLPDLYFADHRGRGL